MSSTNLPKNLDYRNRIRSNRNQTDKENLEFLRAESRTGLEKLLTLSNSRIPRPTATAIRNQRPEECMALQIWKPKYENFLFGTLSLPMLSLSQDSICMTVIPFFSPVTSAVCPSPSLRMPTRSSSLGNLRENQLDEYEGMDCAIKRDEFYKLKCARIE